MTASTGLKIFACSAILMMAIFSPAHAENSLTPEQKAKIAAMAAAAKPVLPVVSESTIKPTLPPAAPLPKVPPVSDADLQDLEPIPAAVAQDSPEIEPLRLTLDKPEIVRLDRDAINVIVGSNENLRVVPDTNKNLILIAKKPGSTYFRALDSNGKVIMQRHVIIGSPSKNYIRIRRACANGAQNCKQYSVYYCPDMCHEVDVVQDASGPVSALPQETAGAPAPAGAQGTNTGTNGTEGNTPTTTPATPEPAPGE